MCIRDSVSAEAHPWYRIITADLFVLALLACATFGLAWSYTQFSGMTGLSYLFLVLFILANLVLFGGVYGLNLLICFINLEQQYKKI